MSFYTDVADIKAFKRPPTPTRCRTWRGWPKRSTRRIRRCMAWT